LIYRPYIYIAYAHHTHTQTHTHTPKHTDTFGHRHKFALAHTRTHTHPHTRTHIGPYAEYLLLSINCMIVICPQQRIHIKNTDTNIHTNRHTLRKYTHSV